MTPTYRTHGNAQPWKPTGYQDRARIEGPIQPLEQDTRPLNWWLIGMGPMIGLAWLMIGVVR